MAITIGALSSIIGLIFGSILMYYVGPKKFFIIVSIIGLVGVLLKLFAYYL